MTDTLDFNDELDPTTLRIITQPILKEIEETLNKNLDELNTHFIKRFGFGIPIAITTLGNVATGENIYQTEGATSSFAQTLTNIEPVMVAAAFAKFIRVACDQEEIHYLWETIINPRESEH